MAHPVPSERPTVFDALRAYAFGGASAAFDEREHGLLQIGMKADTALLDRDPFEVPTHELHTVDAVGTLIDGRPVQAPPRGSRGSRPRTSSAERRSHER